MRHEGNDVGGIRFAFGKHRGKPVQDHVDYLRWILSAEFAADVKQLAKNYLRRYSAAA